jgi:hypothetical protein
MLSVRSDPPAATSGARSCRECVHALALQRELWCLASVGSYTCREERELSPLRAIVLRACGRRGRFFSVARS